MSREFKYRPLLQFQVGRRLDVDVEEQVLTAWVAGKEVSIRSENRLQPFGAMLANRSGAGGSAPDPFGSPPHGASGRWRSRIGCPAARSRSAPIAFARVRGTCGQAPPCRLPPYWSTGLYQSHSWHHGYVVMSSPYSFDTRELESLWGSKIGLALSSKTHRSPRRCCTCAKSRKLVGSRRKSAGYLITPPDLWDLAS